MRVVTLRAAWLWACLLISGWSPAAQAENWPGWRGPRGDGTSQESNLPVTWSATENVAWKTPLPGVGHASPIIWGDRIFTVSAILETEERVLMCLDRVSGQMVWQKTILKSPLEKKHRLNSHASSTPATDGERLYVSFLDGKNILVAALDMDGNEKWRVSPGEFKSVHGFCSCPVLYKDLVIINGDHDGNSYLVGLDKSTGETKWKTMRENKTRSYCTPLVRTIDGREQLLLSGSKCVASYDPNTGTRHWIVQGPTEQFVASLVYEQGLLFVTGGFPDHHILTIRPTGSGDVTDSHIVWRATRGVSYVPSPIAAGKYFLLVSDGGIATEFEGDSGRQVWQERIGPHFSASLVSGGGHVYFLSDEGVTTVIKPGETKDVVAKNALGEHCYASPAISQGQLFIRSERHLWAIGGNSTALRPEAAPNSAQPSR